MRKIPFLFCLLLSSHLATSPAIRAQNALPSSFGNWKEVGPTTAATAQPPESEAFHEYGIAGAEHATFQRGKDALDVTLWRFQDPTGGYGGYSYLRTSDMTRSNLTEHATYSENEALILVGNLVLQVNGKDMPKRMAGLADLLKAVQANAQAGPYPTLWQFLPTKGMVEGTNHYVLGPAGLDKFLSLAPGDWLGFSDGVEAEVAKYHLAGQDVSLLLADFPTPQFAQKRLEELEHSMKINEATQGQNSPALYAKRSQTLIAIVAGAKSQADANILLDQINIGSEVTWNEPTFQFTQPNIGTIVVGTIVGTGVICMFALIAGVAFGGVRIVTKIAFPDKVFDRSSQVQILQLGLSSKPINAEDFYGIDVGRRKRENSGKV
ncbi:MAG TPA: DUF6599 family protein [Verrucomicrobiae bacterium]|nr:DUF6599 family protein [Verrucomicrobiae bacterium]